MVSEKNYRDNDEDENPNYQVSQFNVDEHLDDLAELLVEKILASDRFDKVWNKKKSELPRYKWEGREKEYRKSDELLRMRDLVDYDYKPLTFSQNFNFAKYYLEVIRLVYSELVAEFGEEFYQGGKGRYWDLNINADYVVNLLCCVESLVLRLYYLNTPAYIFDSEDYNKLDGENIFEIKRRITESGSLLLYIFHGLKHIRKMKRGIYLSYNIKLFLEFIREYSFKPKRFGLCEEFLDEVVHFEALNELNNILCRLKIILSEGELNHRQEFPTYGNSRGAHIHNKVDTSNKSRDFKNNFKNYASRIEAATKYFSGYKKNDIVLYRFRINLDCNGDLISLDQHKNFFREWNKKASKPKVGIEGYLNFFYFWVKHQDQWLQDIVIIMDGDTLMLEVDENNRNFGVRSICDELTEYLYQIINHRDIAIFGDGVKPTLNVEPTPLMWHLDLPPEILIQANDRKSWVLFEKKILPFFIYHDFLQVDMNEDMSERFKRGIRKTN